VVNFFFAGYFLPNLAQPGPVGPPKDKVVILGDGNTKGKLRFATSFSYEKTRCSKVDISLKS